MQNSGRIIALLILLPGMLAAQWMPYVAKHRLIQTVTKDDGSKEVDRQEEGIAGRSSSGSEIRTLAPIPAGNGVFQGSGTATFRDASTGTIYEIKNGPKTYSVMDQIPTPWRPINPQDTPSTVVDRQVINGIACVALPVQGKGLVKGAMWRSMAYDMIVKLEMVVKLGTATTSFVEELYDIEIGKEPDSSLLRVPQAYTKIASLQNHSCPPYPKK